MYSAEISRSNPTAFLFLVDQSASMNEPMISGSSKAEFVADVLNRTLRDLVVRCTREDGVRNYFEVGLLTYSHSGVENGFSNTLASSWLHPISVIADNTLRVEDRVREVDDGVGQMVQQTVKFPVWLDPKGFGGTPMQEAIAKAAHIVAEWSDGHPMSFPLTVLNITDGESSDGSPEHNAAILRSLTTNDGKTLLYNVDVASGNVDPLRFPESEAVLPNEYAKLLFRMSSQFPSHIRDYARDAYGISLSPSARAMMLNAEAEDLVKFIDIGSRPAAMR